MEQQIISENTAHLDVQTNEQPLVAITESITKEVVQLDSDSDVKVINEESAVLLVLTEGGSLYKKAVNDGYSGTELEWLTEVLDSKASVQFVVTTVADGYTAYAAALINLEARVGNSFVRNTHLSEVIAQRDLARALDKLTLEAKIDTDIQASYTAVIDVMVTNNLAISQTLNTLSAELGSFSSVVSSVQQAIATETEARTLAMTTMSSTLNNRISAEIVTINQTVVNETSSLSQQINSLDSSFNNLLTANINTVNQAITTESSARASQINTLRTDFTNGISAVLQQVQEVQIDVDGNTSAIDSLTATITNPTTGLNAAFTRANQAWTLANNTAGSLSVIEGKVNHPTTGLAATYAFAQQVLIDANDNTSTAINNLRNEIIDPTANWTANNTFIQSIKSTADNALNATTTINSTVSSLDNWKINTATVELTSLRDDVGNLQSKAFIGVSSTVGGKATIAGLTINSIDYSLRFQGNIFELTNTSGVQQLYYDTAEGVWKFAGALVAASFKTATSGFRVEMDGTSAYPLWFGTGVKNDANARFFLDSAGNIRLFNAQLQGGLVTDNNGTSTRGEYKDDGTYLIWLGTGAKTDVNGTFWVKKNGTGFIKGEFFQGQIIETKYGSYSNTANEAALAQITNHSSNGKTVEVTVGGTTRARATGGDYSSVILEATGQIWHNGNPVQTIVTQTKGIYNADLNRTEWYLNYNGSYIKTATGVAGTLAFDYVVYFAILNGSTPNFTYIAKQAFIKTFENKLE